jgi:hypothetical protein
MFTYQEIQVSYKNVSGIWKALKRSIRAHLPKLILSKVNRFELEANIIYAYGYQKKIVSRCMLFVSYFCLVVSRWDRFINFLIFLIFFFNKIPFAQQFKLPNHSLSNFDIQYILYLSYILCHCNFVFMQFYHIVYDRRYTKVFLHRALRMCLEI